MAKRVFISGVAGFLGSNLAARFLAAGYEVAGIDNFLGGELPNVPHGTEFLEADCFDTDAYRELMRGSDLVFHCAAAPYEGLSFFSPAMIYHHTLQSTVSLLSTSIAAGAKRFIFCSSIARYGTGDPPFVESQNPVPNDPYGWAKLASEHAVKSLCEYHGVEWVIAVPHNIYGENQRFNDPYRNVIAIMINRMLQGKQPIIYGDGMQRRCFSYVADVLDPLIVMAESHAAAGEVFNVGPDYEEISVLDLAQALAKLLDFQLAPIFVPARPGEVHIANCSFTKARNLLGYSPQWNLDSGLKRMIEHIRARGPLAFRYNLPIEIETTRTPLTWTRKLI